MGGLAAGHLDRSASAQTDQKAAGDGDVDFVNPFQVDDFFAARAKEHGGIELFLEGVERPADERPLGSEMDAGVVAFGFKQEDVGNPNDPAALTVSDEYLIEAASICLIGGAIGLGIAWPVTFAVQRFLPATMSANIVGIALLVSLVTGVLSGFFPAWRAARMNPVDALRNE